MPRSPNAQLAVDSFNKLLVEFGWTPANAWHGIALLLLSCKNWQSGWQPFHDIVVYREVNDFKIGVRGPNKNLQRGEELTAFLAKELSIERSDLCHEIGRYWQDPRISQYQPNNLVGHAFRSLVVNILEKFGDNGVTYSEEVSPYDEFPGLTFTTRSKKPKIDIVARRGKTTVALLSSRWRFRHDRVDVVDEALAYVTGARRHNPSCKLYAVVGEFVPSRLEKILTNCPPAQPQAALTATIHFAPDLITYGLGENGRLKHLKNLEWLISESFRW